MDKIITVSYICIKNRKLLLALCNGKNVYYMPGGKIEKGETNKQALIREVKEELSVDLLLDSVTFFQTFKAQAYGKPIGVEVHLKCYTGEFKGKMKANNEINDIKFFSYEKYFSMPETAPGVVKIFKSLKRRGLVD